MKLSKEQIKANEDFFDAVIRQLNDGGFYIYPEAEALFRKHGDKLHPVIPPDLKSVRDIVSKEFLETRFKLP